MDIHYDWVFRETKSLKPTPCLIISMKGYKKPISIYW